jgi:hypothetical protein
VHGQAKRTRHKEEEGNNNDSGGEWTGFRTLRLRLSRPHREYDRLCDWSYPCLISGQDGMPLSLSVIIFWQGSGMDILRYIRVSQRSSTM